MVLEKYVCEICRAFESFDRNEVEDHEKIPVIDIGIEGLILKDRLDKYYLFVNANLMDKDHKVQYKFNMVSAPEKSVLGLVNEAKAMDMIGAAIHPIFKNIKPHTPDDVMKSRLIESGWQIVDDFYYNLYSNKSSFQKVVSEKDLFEIGTDEFIEVVSKIKEANQEYCKEFKFYQKIPKDLK